MLSEKLHLDIVSRAVLSELEVRTGSRAEVYIQGSRCGMPQMAHQQGHVDRGKGTEGWAQEHLTSTEQGAGRNRREPEEGGRDVEGQWRGLGELGC